MQLIANRKQTGFLVAESMTALALAVIGVTLIALIVGQSRLEERNVELKTDQAFAWHIMKKSSLQQIKVHDRIYKAVGDESIFDTVDKKTYQVKK